MFNGTDLNAMCPGSNTVEIADLSPDFDLEQETASDEQEPDVAEPGTESDQEDATDDVVAGKKLNISSQDSSEEGSGADSLRKRNSPDYQEDEA